ncbi:MAG: MaoC family dehydratase N-terminal domain-containing protein [Thiothrix sp.]|nr:MaoC family dehydratase N-terminal domain-containing protein [Thiothrix sp.]HPE60186.1 MaoC family dehydratase N-terminal domain-containing protein [Thiolinea sp.]
MTIDLEHLRSWIGQSESATQTLSPERVRQFNATFDRSSDLSPGAEAPLLIHLCLAQPAAATAELGEDGHPARGGFLPPVPLPRRMWAGGELVFHEPIRIGEAITRHSTIRDVTLKQGRSGALCFVTVEHAISSNGRLALNERQDIVYRTAATDTDKPASGTNGTTPAPTGVHNRRIHPGAPWLFRYSALSFNGHRIHYDLPYAREVEGYPGLVVHGPLQATLLLQYAADLRHQPPARFRFRSLSPLFNNSDFSIHATPDGDELTLWSARSDGPIAMEARATW